MRRQRSVVCSWRAHDPALDFKNPQSSTHHYYYYCCCTALEVYMAVPNQCAAVLLRPNQTSRRASNFCRVKVNWSEHLCTRQAELYPRAVRRAARTGRVCSVTYSVHQAPRSACETTHSSSSGSKLQQCKNKTAITRIGI